MIAKTYYEIKLENSSRIFESHEIEGMTPHQILEAEKLYEIVLEKLKKKEPVDEGIFGTIAGGLAGGLFGSAIMKAICHALGIEKGVFYDLLTSKLILTIVGAKIGNKL